MYVVFFRINLIPTRIYKIKFFLDKSGVFLRFTGCLLRVIKDVSSMF